MSETFPNSLTQKMPMSSCKLNLILGEISYKFSIKNNNLQYCACLKFVVHLQSETYTTSI